MPIALQARLDRLDQDRHRLVAELSAWPVQHLTARPDTGGWSALEILEHLVVAEREILGQLPDPATLAPRARRPRHKVRHALVWLVLRFRIPVKVPSPTMVPAGGASLTELTTRWEATFAWVRALLPALGDRLATEALFRHPVAGPITLAQALELDRLHLRVHEAQVARLRRTLGA